MKNSLLRVAGGLDRVASIALFGIFIDEDDKD